MICDWSNPGTDRLTEPTPIVIIAKYKEIPVLNRLALAAKVQLHSYDDLITIKAGKIEGTFDYDSEITRMTFGHGRICDMITRKNLKQEQGAMVYFSGPWRLGVAAVCGNTFLVTPGVPVDVVIPIPVWAAPVMQQASYQVPELSSIWLVLAGLLGICATKRTRRD